MIESWIDIPNLQTVNLPRSFWYVQSKSVNSICMDMNKWIDVHDSLVQLPCGNKLSIIIIRTCGSWAYEESFDIYQGSSSTNSLFHQETCSAMTTNLCINPVVHTIVMKDSYGDGWSSGSSVTVRYHDQKYTYSGPTKSSLSRSFHFVYFSFYYY